MKTSFLLNTLWVAVISAVLGFSAPLLGEDSDTVMLNKAFDLVHQAWNPGGDPPSNAQRTDLLTQALKLVQEAPQPPPGTPRRGLRGHRTKAIEDIKTALSLIKEGDPAHQAVESIRDAASELRDALSIVE